MKTPLGFSDVVTATRARLSPTLQTIPQFAVNGKQYVVAQTPDFRSLKGNPNMLAGVVAAQGGALALSYQIRIGGTAANVQCGDPERAGG